MNKRIIKKKSSLRAALCPLWIFLLMIAHAAQAQVYLESELDPRPMLLSQAEQKETASERLKRLLKNIKKKPAAGVQQPLAKTIEETPEPRPKFGPEPRPKFGPEPLIKFGPEPEFKFEPEPEFESIFSQPSLLLDPISIDNQQLTVAVYGIPEFESARIPPHLRWTLRYNYKLTNEYYFRRGDKINPSVSNIQNFTEYLILDYEKDEHTISFRLGLYERFEIGLELTYLVYYTGELDNFVNSFHRTFGLKEGGRDRVPNGRFKVVYVRDGKIIFQRNDPFESGLGDTQLSFGYLIHASEDETEHSTLRLRVKLPTGNPEAFSGSGSTDVGFDYTYSDTDLVTFNWFGANKIAFHMTAGYMYLGPFDAPIATDENEPGEEIEIDFQTNHHLFLYTAFNFLITDYFSLKSSIHFASPVYESEIVGLSSPSIQTIFAAGFRFSEGFYWDIGISEDPITGSSPDFSLISTFKFTH